MKKEIKERPILFNGEMVRAILEGRKTQTRIVVKNRKGWNIQNDDTFQKVWGKSVLMQSPFGKVGDRLWVRETWGVGTRPCSHRGDYSGIEFRADVGFLENENDDLGLYHIDCDELLKLMNDKDIGGSWKPSIHMPRWASRITLEITNIRVERLQDISEEDAKAEGLRSACKDGKLTKYGHDGIEWYYWDKDPRVAFRSLWGTVAKEDVTGWNANPWVWVVEFKRIDK